MDGQYGLRLCWLQHPKLGFGELLADFASAAAVVRPFAVADLATAEPEPSSAVALAATAVAQPAAAEPGPSSAVALAATLTVYQANVSTLYQRPADTHILTVY
jgi:hypothetical protein